MTVQSQTRSKDIENINYKPLNDIELYMDMQKKFAEQKLFMSFIQPATVRNILIILSMSQKQVNTLYFNNIASIGYNKRLTNL